MNDISPGPWSVHGPIDADHGPEWEVSTEDGHGIWVAKTQTSADAFFIAAAPERALENFSLKAENIRLHKELEAALEYILQTAKVLNCDRDTGHGANIGERMLATAQNLMREKK